MGAEVLLYAYGLVCLCMLVFNLIYGLHLRSDDRRRRRRVVRLRRRMESQMNRLRDPAGGEDRPLPVRHLTWMRRRLSHVSGLLAFDELMRGLDGNDAASEAYVLQLQPVLLDLATVYLRRESTQAAYFCYFLSRYRLRRHMEMDQLQRVVLSYLERDNLYCKINALKALCGFASPSVLADALVALGEGRESQLHEKVITEALFSYTGEPAALIERLWACLDRFSLPIQRAVLDYIRFRSGMHCGRMLEILTDPRRDKELHLAAIRYFGRYPYEPAREELLRLLRRGDASHWEYAAISASALSAYPGQETVDALLKAMNSVNWHIRNNASVSLQAHGLTYEEMLRVLDGEDRYAREMLAYRLKARRLEEQAASDGAQPYRKTARKGAAVSV